MNPPKTKHKTVRNAIITLLILICIGVSFFVYQALKPYPLGDPNKLEYIGKKDYGCLICDSMPASVYYYATDMSPSEVERYFKNAREYKPIEQDISYTRIWLIHDNIDFIIEYYPDGAAVHGRDFRGISKHMIGVASFDYKKAVESL